MILQVLLLASVAAAAPTVLAPTTDSFDYFDPNPSYSVAWEVKNEPTFDDKSQQETLQDGTVEGRYSYLRPDGKLQVVTYRANDEIGFVVNVDVQDVMPPFGAAGRPASADTAGNTGRSLKSSAGTGSFGSQATGKSFSSTSSASSSSSSSTGRSFSSGNSLKDSQSFTSSSSLNSINRGTSAQRRRRPVPTVPVLSQTSRVPNVQAAFVRPAPVIQPAVVQPAAAVRRVPAQRPSAAVRRVPVRRPSAAARPVLQPAFRQPAFRPTSTGQRGFNSIPAIQSAFPRITTRRPPPPRPTPTTLPPPPPPPPNTIPPPPPPPPSPSPPSLASSANRGRSFTGTSFSQATANRGRSFTGTSFSQARGSSHSTGVAHVSFNSPTHQYSYPLVVNN